MKKHYPWLWFDADGTLFDFTRAEVLSLKTAFESVNTPFKDEYLDAYREINQQLWRALELREITPDALKVRRFELLVEAIQLTCSADHLSAAYLEQLATCAELIDGAHEILDTLRERCRVAIVTNGLQAVQRGRVANSMIREHISELIISEEIGVAKPEHGFFEVASARTGNPDKSEVLMIGDSLSSDIRGGANYGLDTCWYNPTGEARPNDLPITYEISDLRDLLDLIH